MGAIKKRCPTCHQLYEGKRCPTCTRKYQNKRMQKNEARKMYGSRKWEKCRKNVLIKYMGYDIWMLGIGVYSRPARPVVHHIIERDEAPELAYRLDNLITVSIESHAEIHAMYKKDKEAALERIQAGIMEFRKRFGGG